LEYGKDYVPKAKNCTNLLVLPETVKTVEDVEKTMSVIFRFNTDFGMY
jgi:hypothetical protein